MRKTILATSIAAALVLGAVAPGLAAVNCDKVNKELQLGRWPEDIALGMNLTLAEVKSCNSKRSQTSPPPSSARAGVAPTSAAPTAQKKAGK